jgi:hypothetical protein
MANRHPDRPSILKNATSFTNFTNDQNDIRPVRFLERYFKTTGKNTERTGRSTPESRSKSTFVSNLKIAINNQLPPSGELPLCAASGIFENL